MTYVKFSTISGKNGNGEFKCFTPHGHYKAESAAKYAANHGIVGSVNVGHHVIDVSGKGRGGCDREFEAKA